VWVEALSMRVRVAALELPGTGVRAIQSGGAARYDRLGRFDCDVTKPRVDRTGGGCTANQMTQPSVLVNNAGSIAA
jgi:hypothetical protein